MKENLNIKRRLFITISASLAIAYATLFFISINSLQNIADEEVTKDLDSALSFTKSQFASRPETVLEAMNLQAHTQAVQKMFADKDLEALRTSVQHWGEAFEFLEMITVVDAGQNVLVRTNGRRQVNSFVRGHLLDDLFRRKQPFVATELVSFTQYCDEVKTEVCTVLNDHSEIMVQLILVPVIGQDGRVLGALIAGDDVNKDMYLPYQQQKVFGKNIELLVTQRGSLIASTMPANEALAVKLDAEVTRSLMGGYKFSGTTKLNGKSYDMLAEALHDHRGGFIGSLAVALPHSYFMGIQRDNLRLILLSGAVSMLLIIGLAYLISRQYTLPLRRFSEAIQAIEHGDLSFRLAEDEKFTFRILSGKVNRMVEALAGREAAYGEQNRELARRSQEIDAELAEKTVRLAAAASIQQAVIAGLADGMLIADNTQRIVHCNPAAEVLLGIPADRMLGLTLSSLVKMPGLQELAGLINRDAGDGNTGQATGVSVTIGAKNLSFELTDVLDEQGQLSGMVLAISDETVKGELDRLKGGFVAKVSHELKTPLTSMKGSLQFIINKGKWLTGIERDMLEVCLRNTDRLINIVANIVELSRIESGQVGFSMHDLQLGEVALYAIEEIKGKALARNINLVNEVPLDLPRVYGDYERLSQVVAHLLANAVKFSQPDSVVTLTAAAVDGFVRLAVSDRAKTIPEQYRQDLFFKFQQMGNPEDGEFGGSGLGLAICREIMVKHGGSISYAPGESVGNVFTIRLPVGRGDVSEK